MLGTTLTTLLVGYAAICLLAWLLEDRLTFFPSRHLDATPAAVGLEFEDVWLGAQGARIHGWTVPHPAARARVLFLHGNAGNISHRLETLRLLHDLGCATLILDYPGFGQSEGTLGEAGCARAARAGLEHLRARPGAPIVVWGRSLGGAVAATLAGEPGVDRLVLESTFTSLRDLGQRLYPWLPVRPLARNRFDARQHIARSRTPLLVLHSRDDEIVPFHLGRRLFEAAPEPKAFVELRGRHNAGFLDSGEIYLDALRGFLDD